MRSLRPSTAAVSTRKYFRIVLIKPSHYDDDGYVIRWYRSPMPANSLASGRLLALSGPGDPEQSRSKDGHLQRGYRQTREISPPRCYRNTAGKILPYSLIFAAFSAAA